MQKLFTEFNPVTASQWKEQLIKDLKGIDYNQLVWKNHSGFDIQPFYTKEHLPEETAPLLHQNDWSICESIEVQDEKTANHQALNALENGASGLIFHISENIDFAKLLDSISLPHIYTLFRVNASLQSGLLTYLSSHNYGNNWYIECDDLLNGNINTVNDAISIDAALYQEAGSHTVHELAFTLAHLNEYLTNTPAVSRVHLSISVGGDFFMEISKIRALRKLTQFLLDQYSIKANIHIHAQTTLINKSSVDNYNNMLRSTTEAMSAAIGGANSIHVLPFDHVFKAPTEFSLRMARNQQLILKEESYLNAVSDIAAGSYYIESVTEELCIRSWDNFKSIEAKGGMLASLKSGYVKDLISNDASILLQEFKDGTLILVGINKFQNKHDSGSELQWTISTNTFGIQPINLSRSFEPQSVN